jgi:hypothetical protein
MNNKLLSSLKLDRYIAVVVVKDLVGNKRAFSPIVGVNLQYGRGYPEFFVNILNVQTDGTGLGADPHFSGHGDIVAFRSSPSSDLGHTPLLKPLNDRDNPMESLFNLPKHLFLPGYNKRALSGVKYRWTIAASAIQDGLHFDFRFWPEKRRPTPEDIQGVYAMGGRGEPLRLFVHDEAPNVVTLAVHQGSPNIEIALSFQIDQPLESSADEYGSVYSRETIAIGGPRKTWKN